MPDHRPCALAQVRRQSAARARAGRLPQALGTVTALEHLWPDPDRRDDALLRVAVRCARSETLTPAERRCLSAAACGLRRMESATVLGLSPHTIDSELLKARRRLRAKTTTHAVAEALRQGLIL